VDNSRESKILVNNTPPPPAEEQVQFLTNVQRILGEGSFVATYKYALLLALADLCLEQGSDSGDGLTVGTREVAEKFIQYYWLQCRPYRTTVLKQNTGKQPEVLRLLEGISSQSGGSIFQAKKNSREWQSLVRAVENVVKKMPLWRLQTVGRTSLEVLYPNVGHGDQVHLKPGVPFCFRKFYQLVGDLVRGAWVRYVRRFNPDVFGSADDLHEFLFGSERSNLQQVGRILYEVQEGVCFYCRKSLNSEVLHVDHFIPWSRYPVDLGHNFVLAHSGCNAAKSDFLAALPHLSRWLDLNRADRELNARFTEMGILHDLPRSLRIAEWAYNQAHAAGAFTWLRGKDCIPLPSDWRSSFGTI
jgi:hypothetical protein